MLQNVRLKNFKCFEHVRLECTPLTLLCGLNGMGKSSRIPVLIIRVYNSGLEGVLGSGGFDAKAIHGGVSSRMSGMSWKRC